MISINSKLKWLIYIFIISLILSFLFRWQGIAQWLWQISNKGQWLMPLIIASALVDSLNPCAISILFVTIGVVMAISPLRKRVLFVGGSYILGIFVVYFLIGLGLLQAFHLFNIPHFMGKLGAILLFILGLHGGLTYFLPSASRYLKIPSLVPHKILAPLVDLASIPTAFIAGALVGLCEFPCTGGPYLTAIGLLHDQATVLNGLAYLVLYNLIFILPLTVILTLAGNPMVTEAVSNWQKTHKKPAKLVGAITAILLAVVIWQFS